MSFALEKFCKDNFKYFIFVLITLYNFKKIQWKPKYWPFGLLSLYAVKVWGFTGYISELPKAYIGLLLLCNECNIPSELLCYDIVSPWGDEGENNNLHPQTLSDLSCACILGVLILHSSCHMIYHWSSCEPVWSNNGRGGASTILICKFTSLFF